MRILLLTMIFLLSPILSASIYQWTDAQGNVHFSDRPQKGAKRVELPEVQVFTPPVVAPINNTPKAQESTEEESNSYSSLSITYPEDEATLRDSQGMVQVNVTSDPPLSGNDQYQMIFDGKKLGPAQKSPSFVLSNVNRGSHTLAVQIVNQDGNVLIESDSITIFMHPPRTNMVPRN